VRWDVKLDLRLVQEVRLAHCHIKVHGQVVKAFGAVAERLSAEFKTLVTWRQCQVRTKHLIILGREKKALAMRVSGTEIAYDDVDNIAIVLGEEQDEADVGG
jgi:hypothetical protein